MEIGLLMLLIMAVSSFLGAMRARQRRNQQRREEEQREPVNYPSGYPPNQPPNYPPNYPQNQPGTMQQPTGMQRPTGIQQPTGMQYPGGIGQPGQMPAPGNMRAPGTMNGPVGQPNRGGPFGNGQLPTGNMPQRGTPAQAPGSWEEMERQYGIRIERKETPSTVQMRPVPQPVNQNGAEGQYQTDRTQQRPQGQMPPRQTPMGQVPMEQRPSQQPSRQAPRRQMPSGQMPQTQSPSGQYPQQRPMERPSYGERSTEHSGYRPSRQQPQGTAQSGRTASDQVAAISESGPFITPTFDPAYKQRKTHDKFSHIPAKHRGPKLPPGGLRAGIKWSIILERPKALQRRA